MLKFSSVARWAIAAVVCGSLWGCANNVTPEETELALEPNQDWTLVEHEGIQLEIPPNFVVGQPGLELEELQASLTDAGFGDRTDWLAQNAEDVVLLAFEATDDQLSAINVVQIGRSPDEALEDYLAQQVTQLEAANITVAPPQIEAEVGILEISADNQEQFIYVYPSAEDFWVVTYSGGRGQLAASTIERSRRSVEILTQAE